jgi:hypothetical protein
MSDDPGWIVPFEFWDVRSIMARNWARIAVISCLSISRVYAFTGAAIRGAKAGETLLVVRHATVEPSVG